MDKFSIFNLQFPNQKGFSLIEMLVVFSIIGITTVTSIAAFFNYNRSQSFTSAVANVRQDLNLARSRAISQVKPSVAACTTGTLNGYEFWFPAGGAGTYYRLSVRCGGTNYELWRKNLPANVTFTTVSGTTTFFKASTGTVTTPTTITISGFGSTQTITVDATGIISVQ